MRIRDRRQKPWILDITEIFEAGFFKRWGGNPLFHELLDYFEFMACNDPTMLGERLDALPDIALRVYVTPPLLRLPKARILFEIDSENGVVRLWSFSIAAPAAPGFRQG